MLCLGAVMAPSQGCSLPALIRRELEGRGRRRKEVEGCRREREAGRCKGRSRGEKRGKEVFFSPGK